MSDLGSSITAYALVVNLPYAIVVVAAALEVAWRARRPGPERRQMLSSAGTASAMGIGSLVVGVAYAAVLAVVWGPLSRLAPPLLTELWSARPVVGAVAAFVVWDLAGWLYHWLGHRTVVGWAAHQPHHTGTDYDLTLGLRQSWLPVHGLVVHPFVALAGFDLRTVVACAALSNAWQFLQHTSVPVRFPAWFEARVMTPSSHRHHHAGGRVGVNLGPVFTVWDRMAGTWVAPSIAPGPLAVPAVVSNNPVTLELAGWRALLAPRSGQPELH